MNIEYKIIKSKRRTVALEITSNGELLVRSPKRMDPVFIADFIRRKMSWIEKNMARATKKIEQHKIKQFMEGEKFFFRGIQYPLKIAIGQRAALKFDEAFSIKPMAKVQAKATLLKWYKQQAREVLTDKADRMSKLMQVKYAKLKITDAKKRWGSCSSKGNINFSWRLVMAPDAIIDYVIIHELCHLKHHNHSKRFWNLVENYLPEHKKYRKWLRENGHIINII